MKKRQIKQPENAALNLLEESYDFVAVPRRFAVYDDIPEELRKRLESAAENPHLKGWTDTVLSVPQYTDPLPDICSNFIKTAREIWKQNVCGNEEILSCILRHAVEYGMTGKTSPILLDGPPGIGKTLIAKTYSAILQLPYAFVSGPAAALNRGLAGASTLYAGGGAGAIAQAMITSGIGNPVICVDEIDKVTDSYKNAPNFINELLCALDDSNVSFRDNYIEMNLDISHIPFVFTANDLSGLPSPLLDRMEVIHMQPPTKELLRTILKTRTLPEILAIYNCPELRIRGSVLTALVDQLWDSGNRSCRPYQKALARLVSDTYIKMLETGFPVKVTAHDALFTAQQFEQQTVSKPIGFLSA